MTIPIRILAGVNSPPSVAAEPPTTMNLQSDYVIVLAALLCALICALGLAVVARCSWFRSCFHSGTLPPPPPPPTRGLKKKVLRSLPTLTFNSSVNEKQGVDCAICLTEFADGDEVRELPQCGHVFHVKCVDKWLVSHSSCPSCRHVLVVGMGRCQKCGGIPETNNSS